MLAQRTFCYESRMPRHADKSERRDQVVQAAFRVLARGGLEALSMRAVAAEAGCTTGLVTHWFASRADLLLAAVESAAQAEETRIRAAFEGGLPLVDALTALLPVDAGRQDEVRVWMSFWAAALGQDDLAAAHRRRYRAWSGMLGHRLPQGSGFSPEMVIAVVDGISVNAILDPEVWTAGRQVEALGLALMPASPAP